MFVSELCKLGSCMEFDDTQVLSFKISVQMRLCVKEVKKTWSKDCQMFQPIQPSLYLILLVPLLPTFDMPLLVTSTHIAFGKPQTW